ncbi:MAG: mechanosensitive ion channel family protein [Candidatus Bathycorpusculaceae bacterium]
MSSFIKRKDGIGMIPQDFFEYLESQTLFGVRLSTIIWIIAIGIVALILERVLTRYLRRFARRARLAPYVANSLILTSRILILVGTAAALFRVGGLQPEWIIALSALGGTAVGFASTKTIGNFIAGLFLFAARPFRVGDYVRIGTVEGIVQEITINYTKILTLGNNIVSISNIQILDRDITNYAYESEEHISLYCYTFEIGLDHSVSSVKIAEIFNEVFERYKHMLSKRPSYMLVRSGAFERVYMVYLYVEHPEDIFVLRPQIAEEIFKRWDMERAKAKT